MSLDPSVVAGALLAARAEASTWTPPPGLDLTTAWQVAALTDTKLRDAGEQTRGWKIGFTNRGIWPRYGVFQPIWARVWDSTLTMLDGTDATVSLTGLVQPRLEPEIVFGFGRAPEPGMDGDALAACIDWVAHGLEVVHTHVPGWHFDGPAAPVADFGLHGRLFVGPRRPMSSLASPGPTLASLTLTLSCGGETRDQGRGANVLDGPLNAVCEWLMAMATQTPDVRVQAGELVTTGTLTDAWPLAPGEVWHTQLEGAPLPGLCLRCEP